MNTTTRVSLRTKIMGMLIGLCLAFGVTILFVFEQTAKTSEDEKLKTYGGYAIGLSESISAQFYERYGDVQAFAMNDVVMTAKPDLISEEFNQYAALYGIYDLILMVDLKGRFIAANNKAPDGSSIKLEALKKLDYSGEPWFKAVINQQFTEDKSKGFVGTYVEDAQVDKLTSAAFGKAMYGNSLSAIVKNQDGTPMAVITARPGFRWVENEFIYLYKRLLSENLGSTQIRLLDKSGVVLVDYDPQKNGNKQEIIHDFDKTLLKENLADAGLTAAKNVIQGREGSIYQDHEGFNEAFGYAPVKGAKFVDSIGWNVIIQVHRDELTANLLVARKRFWLSIVICLALAAIISALFAQRLSGSLLRVAQNLSSYSVDIAGTSNHIAGSSAQLSEASAEQASALQQTVAAIDEISAMVNKNAESAKLSLEVSSASEKTAQAGQQAVQNMILSMNEISQSNINIMSEIDNSNKEISEIVKVIGEIGNKTKVINDIVFQTKLLSFNASVEAARAGEHGKGFAVVAEEVGNLAQVSGNAAKEISSMLDSSIERVGKIVDNSKRKVSVLMESGRDKVEDGITTAKDCGKVLEDILANVTRVNQMVSEIATASEEQALGVQEVTKSMNQLDQVTQQNLGVAQQSSTSAEQLSSRSDSLKGVSFELLDLIGAERPSVQADSSDNNTDSGMKIQSAKVVSIRKSLKSA